MSYRHLIITLILLTGFPLVILASSQQTEEESRYIYASSVRHFQVRLYLSDKHGTPYTLSNPSDYLSHKAIERRKRQNLPLDSTDLPLTPAYLNDIRRTGAEIDAVSKWNNTVLVRLQDSTQWKQLAALPFVSRSKKVWTEPDSTCLPPRNRGKLLSNTYRYKESKYYGEGQTQIDMLNGTTLHEAGFKGKDMTIAVIDAGYFNADKIKALSKARIIGTKDFINPHSDIYAENEHGMKVLSCMAANEPYAFVGTAPDASYWLLRSENSQSESLAEEDYWAAAVEFADSAGVDIINTSVGYYRYDDPSQNFKYKDLDGKTMLISRTAAQASSKGIIICCSAGNTGTESWKKITIPADADHILSIGAVDRSRTVSLFSAVGNTADNRIKPDIMGLGSWCAVCGINGNVTHGSGTSFSSPILCGLIACLWEAFPKYTAEEMMGIVRKCSDNTQTPDNVYGYGIPDFRKAYLYLKSLQ